MSRISLFRGVRTVGVAAAILAAPWLLSPANAQTSVAATVRNQKSQAGAPSVPASGAGNDAAARTVSQASDQAAAANQAVSGEPLTVGRVIYAELTQTIDVRKVKLGDPIFARTTLAVLSHGKVLIAEGARITGHVTEATTRSKEDSKSVLGIVFDSAETSDGKELPLETTVQAIGIGELRAAPGMRPTDENTYSAVPGTFSIEQPRSGERDRDDELPKAETSPALDIGSKGVIGVKAMELTEAKDAAHGSLVTSLEKNVKLDNRWQVVLRVIAPAATAANKK